MADAAAGAPQVQVAPGCHFDFAVAEPEKKEKPKGGPLDFSYWTYHVYTKTTLEQYRSKSMVAVRRYNDFVWLRDQLVEDHPGCIVPPIPQKSIKGSLEKVVGINTNPLVEYRQRAMRKFLVRVGAHSVLCTSAALQDFLELSEDEFARRVKHPGKKDKIEVELTTAERMKQMIGQTPAKASEEAAAWEETRQYVQQLENSLTMLKDRIELLVKRRRETSGSLAEFGKSFAKVGEIEQQYEEGSLANALIDVGHHSEHLALVYQEQADNETIQVVETIGYYVGLCNAVRECIKRLLRMSATRDTLAAIAQSLIDERGAASAAGKEAKVKSLDAEIQKVSQRRDAATRCVDEVTTQFKSELRRFHREKQYDVKQMLKSFVELQLEYANKMKKSWETLLPSVEAIKID
eukprot:TRINITY_DN16330_c0_g2_i1.p1 TRINITY_DN16330_c0_g2~~TRINITY_DN16330_c0_g2_i1.p1  ORF type:complete len:434 (+),score=171.60 TRINITY_DN16330_c0_g2_i1:87-1304(+)